MPNKTPTTYRLLDIILLESHFKRADQIDLSDPEIENSIDIATEDQLSDNNLYVTLTLIFKLTKNKKNDLEATIKILGIFECSEKSSLQIDDFAKINAPAIIFPFIREHLATVTMKAGINPILLPPINFVKRAETIKPQKNSL